MAGPGTSRAWLISDDPGARMDARHLAEQPVDQRLPFYGTRGTGQAPESRGRMRLTVAQALVRFLSVQYTERDGVRPPADRRDAGASSATATWRASARRCVEAGPDAMPLPPGAQRTGHGARGRRLRPAVRTGCPRMACTTSIGPGATNLVTGAALATVNRLPVLLLPGDVFATRRADPVLQQLEVPWAYDISVNDALRPVSRFFDRIWPPGDAAPLAPPGDAGAHRPGRHRRGHARAAAGRAGGGVRLPGRVVPATGSGRSGGPRRRPARWRRPPP